MIEFLLDLSDDSSDMLVLIEKDLLLIKELVNVDSVIVSCDLLDHKVLMELLSDNKCQKHSGEGDQFDLPV